MSKIITKAMMSFVLIITMLIGTCCSTFASAEADTAPTADFDFESYEIGESVLAGEVAEYQNSKALKMSLGSVLTTLSVNALVVGEAAVVFDFAATGSVKGTFGVQGGGTPVNLVNFNADGSVTTYNGKPVAQYSERIRNMAFVIDAARERFDVYINGRRIIKRCYFYAMFDKIVSFNLALSAPDGEAQAYVDNILVYPTYKRVQKAAIYNPNGKPANADKNIVLTDKNYFPSESAQRSLLKDCVSVHMRSGVVYSKGQKYQLTDMPYYSGDEFMVPSEFLDKALGLATEQEDENITIGNLSLTVNSNIMKTAKGDVTLSAAPELKDGVMYLPLRAIAKDGLGKSVYYDDTTTHYGMIVISDRTFNAPMGADDLQALNDFCFFFRPSREQFAADYNASELKGQHPRIMATAEDFERIRLETESNPQKAAWKKQLLTYCDNNLNDDALVYELRDGVRLLYVAEDFNEYILTFAMAYQLTGERKYFDAAWKHIESVANMPDWNPAHHIDVGIMAFAFAVGYDWFYDIMTPDQRQLMEKGVYNNCFWIINEAVESPDTPYGTVLHENNHNVYTNSGVMACCIAFMDVYPDISSKIGSDVMRMLESFMDKFAPYGDYYEGASYATIAINYTIRLFASMLPTMGTLYGVDKAQGLSLTGEYLSNMQSDVSCYNFGDATMGVVSASGLFWIYDYYGIKGLKDSVAEGRFYAPSADDMTYCLLWYNVEEEEASESASKLDVRYENNEIITMRNSYDPGQVFVGIKAGETNYDHSHLESGSFVFDALGKRWAYDIGPEDYNMYYTYDPWDLFRRRPESHNTLIINPDLEPGYELYTRSNVTKYESKPKGVITLIDMTQLYGNDVTNAKRGYFFTDNRRSLVVRDEVKLTKASDLIWLMYIDSDVEIIGNNTVILTDKTDSSKKLKVEFVSSVPGTVKVEDAVPLETSPQIPGQRSNAGYYRLRYDVSASGTVTITAKLTPMDYYGSDINNYNISMDKWQIPEGELLSVPELDSLTIGGESQSVKNRDITYYVANDESPVPTVAAVSEKYDVRVVNAATIDDITTIILTDPTDTTNTISYKIKFRPKVRKRVFEGYTVLAMNNVTASAEPQPENPASHVLDGDLETRWSADNKQWLMFALESVQSFDTLIMSMYLGDERTSTVTVEISNDGKLFEAIGEYTTSGTTSGYEFFDIGAQNARYVRINFFGTSTGVWNSPSEIVVADKN